MGGRDVELVVVDDELKPDVAIQKVRGMIEHDHVDFVVGPIFSNILVAIHKPVIDAGKILISTNAGTSNFAGAACNPNFFVTSYQNDQIYEAIGAAANKLGYKRVYAWCRTIRLARMRLPDSSVPTRGEIVEESLVPLNTTDFAPEVSKISASKPDALFTFMPGGLGINLLNTYIQAGLKDKFPVISAFTADEATLPVLKDNAVGIYGY
jgi:branched-chain amino acid transport system substrate-binding protein